MEKFASAASPYSKRKQEPLTENKSKKRRKTEKWDSMSKLHACYVLLKLQFLSSLLTPNTPFSTPNKPILRIAAPTGQFEASI